MLINTCDLYRYTPAQDVDGGSDPTNCYPVAPTTAGIACSAQQDGMTREDSVIGRAGASNTWEVFFSTPPTLKVNDKLVLNLPNTTRTVFVLPDMDEAGRGVAYSVTAAERL